MIEAVGGFSTIVDRLRNTTLGDVGSHSLPDFHPYLRSKITLEEVRIDELHPCALYVLEANLERVAKLRKAFVNYQMELASGIFSDYRFDIFNLDKFNSIFQYQWGGKSGCILSPPVVEVSEDDGGISVITDGLHRVTTAKQDGKETITVTKIENIAVPLPALPVSWDEVKTYNEVPSLKRKYRFETMDEIDTWIEQNQERFNLGFGQLSIFDAFPVMDRIDARYAPWDYPGEPWERL